MDELLAGVPQVRVDAAASAPQPAARKQPARHDTPAPGAVPGTAKPEAAKRAVTTQELAEMLHRINLTFDLFEVAAKYSIDEERGSVRVTLINTRTGEVIRRIPPADFRDSFDSFREGLGLLINRLF